MNERRLLSGSGIRGALIHLHKPLHSGLESYFDCFRLKAGVRRQNLDDGNLINAGSEDGSSSPVESVELARSTVELVHAEQTVQEGRPSRG